MSNLIDIEKEILEDLYLVKPTLNNQVQPTDSLTTQHGIESLDMIEFIARIEDRFQIPIEDTDWKKLQSVEQLAYYIQAKQG